MRIRQRALTQARWSRWCAAGVRGTCGGRRRDSAERSRRAPAGTPLDASAGRARGSRSHRAGPGWPGTGRPQGPADGLRERARDGRAAFGTIDSWLIFKLCGEHVTDPSNASRTLLYDIVEQRWSPELCALLGDVPEQALPEVRASCGVLCTTRPDAL